MPRSSQIVLKDDIWFTRLKASSCPSARTFGYTYWKRRSTTVQAVNHLNTLFALSTTSFVFHFLYHFPDCWLRYGLMRVVSSWAIFHGARVIPLEWRYGRDSTILRLLTGRESWRSQYKFSWHWTYSRKLSVLCALIKWHQVGFLRCAFFLIVSDDFIYSWFSLTKSILFDTVQCLQIFVFLILSFNNTNNI